MSNAIELGWRQYRLERKMFWRNPTAAFFNFILPLLFLTLFGAIFSGDKHELRVIIPGIAGMSVMATTFNALANNIVFLREQGVLKRMSGTPLPRGSYLAGIFGNVVTNAAVQILIIVLAAKFVFGIDWPRDVFELFVYVVLGVVCLASLGIALSHVIPNFDSAPAYVNIIFLPVIFISGVFFDVDTAPQGIHDVGSALPLTHVIEGFTGAMVTGSPISHHWSGLGIILAWTVFGIYFAVTGFSWESRSA
jgi:ABC-2 type transport system permease protein